MFVVFIKFKIYIKGFLGIWNGDMLDDYLRFDGIILLFNVMGREIYFDFGLKCKFIVSLL